MFEALFSFSGRIGRLHYFAWTLALSFGIALLAVSLVIVSMAAHVAVPAAVGLIVLLAAPPFLWVSFALQAKRFRDIGWNPAYVIPGWIAIEALDMLIALAAPTQAVGTGHMHTMLGVLVNAVIGSCLLFLPGRSHDDAPTAVEPDWTPPPEWTPVAPVRPPRPAPAAPARASTWNATQPPTGFGRRGL